ncbi:MAG: hypothetical protein J6V82_04815, partial [Clostridia bacterium]|nr:hypothetical protein [Clostridia bacterium]
MKKRYLSLFLLFAFLFTSLPLAVGAKEEILNPLESDNLADKGYVEDTYLYNNEFLTDFGHTSSGTPGSWQSTWGSTVSGVVDPTDSENKVGSVMVTGDKTITKGYLEAKDTLVISVSIYIPAPQQGNYPSAFSVKLSGKSVLKLTYDSAKDAYAFAMGTASGFVPKESWMSFSTVMTADTELGWEKAHLSSQLSGALTDSEGNAQTFVKGEAEIAYTNPQCQFNANVDASSVAGYYLDNFKVYVPGDFGDAKITMPKANDGFDNVILDGKVDVRLLHTPDLATFSPENVRIYNEYGTEIPYTSIKYDIGKPDRMTIDFSQNPLPTFSMLYLDVGEGVKDLQGKEINKRYVAFETFGRVGQRPIAQPLIMPPEGGFVMPDKYNTGYRCDESELIPFAEKYSDIPVAANGEVRINESLAKKYNYEFSHFSLEGSFIITATSPVHFHDFFLDVPAHYGFQNQGSEMLYITNATCTGSRSAMFGGRSYLEKIYCYDVPADHLKGSSYQTSVSCYFANGGYMSPEAHADANQISMFDAESRITKDMYMVGCRLDVPNLPGTVGNSAAIFLAPERVGPYGLANYQLSHNWFNGSAGTVRLGKGQHAEGLFEYVTYAYNRLGYGYQYFAYQNSLNKTELADYGNTMCDSLDVGSIVYYDAQSNRVQTLSAMGEGGSVLVNFANYTKVARDFTLEVVLKDAQGNPVMSFGKDGTVRRYIPYDEYTKAENMTQAVI